MILKGSNTEKNLYTAFTGEVQAYAKYQFFAEKAKEDGYEQIYEFFNYTALNELQHAKLYFELLDFLGDTQENLENAVRSEAFEYNDMYKKFYDEAIKEGFTQIARLFQGIGAIEHSHEMRFSALLNNIENDKVFSKENSVMWECRNCGHIHTGKEAPKVCPICKEPIAYFLVYNNTFKEK